MITRLLLILFFFCFLAGCSTSQDRLYRTLSKDDSNNIQYKGHYKVGKEYALKGQTYKPRKVKHYNKIGTASWYGSKNGFHGKKTANGDKYNKNLLTAAHRTLPLPSLVRVTNLENNKSVVVMVNDRGPAYKKREIDVSERAATILGFKNKGVAKVKVQYLPKESKTFLADIGLKEKEGSKTKKPSRNKKCSINCHIKLVNIKKGINLDSN